jgi:excinuclease ABC subunit C
MTLSSLKNKTTNLPQNPGVYIFKDINGWVVYVGKATNLRSRVSSYFRGGEDARLIGRFMDLVADVAVQETDSVLEALILEANLIKKHQPKYNVLGKDDKSYSYFVITKEEFPRVLIMRKKDLENKYKYVIPSLSKNLTRKKVDPSTPLRSAQDDIKVQKIFGPYTSKRQMEVALKILRKIFPFHSLAAKTEKGCLDFQLGRCPGPYAGAITHADYRKNIRGIRMILEGKKQGLIKKLNADMAEYADKEEFEKAQEVKNKIFALNHVRDVALISIEGSTLASAKVEPLRDLRIEAYDISNISGQHAVGSMVVFQNSEPEKSQYRKFRIKTVEGSNDVGMMAEILFRRFRNNWPASNRGNVSSTRGWPQPDLILLDGGQGHLHMAEKVLRELDLKIPIVAVAKGAKRKNLEFRISPARPGNFKSNSNIKNVLNDKNLIKQIMDEAHRFAIGYHRKLRSKNLLG